MTERVDVAPPEDGATSRAPTPSAAPEPNARTEAPASQGGERRGADSERERVARWAAEYGVALHSWTLRLVRDRTLAEDLVQETFVVALERADARVPAASERAWLFGIARRLAAAALRSRRGFLGLLRRIVRMEPAARPGDVVELAEDGARSPVAAAVASLPARQREVLYLVFHEGMTLDDAAHALEISPGAARQHYHRAKETLRARLAGSSEAAGVEP